MEEPFPRGPLVLPADLEKAIAAHMRGAYPQEGCGLLAGAAGRVLGWFPCRNVHPHPLMAYEADPRDLIAAFREMEARGWELVAICHSHPQSGARPSAADVRQANYPEALYVIWSLADRDRPEVRGFWIRDGQVTEHPVRVE